MGVGSRGERPALQLHGADLREWSWVPCICPAALPTRPEARAHPWWAAFLQPLREVQLTSFLAILLYLNGEVAEGEAVLHSLNPAEAMLCYLVGNLVVCIHSTEKHMGHFH